MRDYCEYTVEAVDGYRSKETDKFLNAIWFDLHTRTDIALMCEDCAYDEGELCIVGYIWHDEINDLIMERAEKSGMTGIPFMIRGVDCDEHYENALTCSFVHRGAANYDDVIVNVIWPKFKERSSI